MVQFFAFFIPAVVGIYLGWTSVEWAKFLRCTSEVTAGWGLFIGLILVAAELIASRKEPANKKPNVSEILLTLCMPVLGAVIFSLLFGSIIFGVRQLIQ